MELFKVVRDRLAREIKLNSIKKNLAAFGAIYAPNVEIDSEQLCDKSCETVSLLECPWVLQKLKEGRIIIKIVKIGQRFSVDSQQYEVSLDKTPNEIIKEYVIHNSSKSDLPGLVEDFNKQNIVLNIVGCDEIIFGNQYKFGSYKVN